MYIYIYIYRIYIYKNSHNKIISTLVKAITKSERPNMGTAFNVMEPVHQNKKQIGNIEKSVNGVGRIRQDSFKLVTSHGFSRRLGGQMDGERNNSQQIPCRIYEILKAIYISDMCAFT